MNTPIEFTLIKITFPNGRNKTFHYSSFEYYSSTKELEHKEENIIIKINDLSHSFVYKTDELSGEIVQKEYIYVELIAKGFEQT